MARNKNNPAPQRRAYPDDIYVTFDSEQNAHFWTSDPLRAKETGVGEQDFGDIILNLYEGQPSDAVNPIMLRFMTYRYRRGDSFDISIPEKIRRHEIDAHLCDAEGNIIEITNTFNQDKEYNLNAVVFGPDGTIRETRKYSSTGQCSDKLDAHKLIVMSGDSNFSRTR